MAQSRAKRNYRKEYDNYQGKPEQIAKRSQRNQARAKMMEAGLAKKGDGKDVDHRRALINGGSNSDSNLRVVSQKANRGFRRASKGRPL